MNAILSPLAVKAELGMAQSRRGTTITFSADGQLVATAHDAADALIALERLLAHPFHNCPGASWTLRVNGTEAMTGTPEELACYVREAMSLADFLVPA
jgi:hypothetical protein